MTTSSIPQKRCTKCGELKPATAEYFWKDNHLADRLMSSCKICRRKRETLPSGYKRCPKCQEIKPLTSEYFGSNISENSGFNNYCKVCWGKIQKNTRDKRRDISKIDIVPEGERRCCICKEIYPATREYFSPNKNGKYHLQSHCKKCAAIQQRRRARLVEGDDGYTARDIEQLYKLQKGLCWWCGKSLKGKYHIDHRIPLSRGGTNKLNNIVLTHIRCNLSKNNKLPHEWIGRLL